LVQEARELLQAGTTCVLFVPFRPADYKYISKLSDDRRRESFAQARDRAASVTGTVSPDQAWSFQSLDGSSYDANQALALSAFPDMNKRSNDLYQSYFIQALEDATGVNLNDNIGKSSKKPYYYAQKVCGGNVRCSDLGPAQKARIQAQTEAARGTISCAENPSDLVLPFTPGMLPSLRLCQCVGRKVLTLSRSEVNSIVLHAFFVSARGRKKLPCWLL
jgi:hypothetical protein